MNSINPKNFFREYQQGQGGYWGGSVLCGTPTAQDIKTDLLITTQEGDKVTLKSNVERQITFNTNEKWVKDGAQNYLWISVQGDLSEQEMEDINKALDAIDQSMRNLINGNLDEAPAATMDVDELETIKSFTGDLQRIEVQDKPLSEAELQKSFETRRDIVFKHFGGLGDNLLESIKETPVQQEELIKPVNKLVMEFFGEARAKDGLSDSQVNFIKEIHTKLLEKLSPQTEGHPHILNLIS